MKGLEALSICRQEEVLISRPALCSLIGNSRVGVESCWIESTAALCFQASVFPSVNKVPMLMSQSIKKETEPFNLNLRAIRREVITHSSNGPFLVSMTMKCLPSAFILRKKVMDGRQLFFSFVFHLQVIDRPFVVCFCCHQPHPAHQSTYLLWG